MSIPAVAARRAAIVPILLLVVAVLVVVRPEPAMAAPYMPFPDPGQQIGQFHLKNYHSGRCVDVPGGSMGENVALHQWTCVKQTNEYWNFRYAFHTVTPIGLLASFRIVNTHSGKCITVPGGNTATGVRLVQRTCNADAGNVNAANSDVWYWIGIANIGHLQNFRTMKCMNVRGASMDNGAQIIQWPCNGETDFGFHPARI